jgi:hypothetical protein
MARAFALCTFGKQHRLQGGDIIWKIIERREPVLFFAGTSPGTARLSLISGVAFSLARSIIFRGASICGWVDF